MLFAVALVMFSSLISGRCNNYPSGSSSFDMFLTGFNYPMYNCNGSPADEVKWNVTSYVYSYDFMGNATKYWEQTDVISNKDIDKKLSIRVPGDNATMFIIQSVYTSDCIKNANCPNKCGRHVWVVSSNALGIMDKGWHSNSRLNNKDKYSDICC